MALNAQGSPGTCLSEQCPVSHTSLTFPPNGRKLAFPGLLLGALLGEGRWAHCVSSLRCHASRLRQHLGVRFWYGSQGIVSEAQKSPPPSHESTASSASIRPWPKAEDNFPSSPMDRQET